ncbi:MAG: radical SAM protein [Elusimicrobiota bacterium]
MAIKIDASAPAFLVSEARSMICRREGRPDSRVAASCLSITSVCNERCVFCLEERDPRRQRHMPYEDARRLVDLFAGRVPAVNFTSSESLLHPRFLDLARRVSRAGSRLGVLTNGLALARPGFIEDCSEAGLREVAVSCHSADRRIFGTLTGAPGRFADFVRGLDALDSFNRTASTGRRVTVAVEIVLMRPLLRELDALFDFLKARLASSRPTLRVETYRPINGAGRRLDLQLDLAEIRTMVRRIIELSRDRFPLSFRHVPLCLLPGREHLATEVGQILRRERTLGNAHSRSLEIVEQARARSARDQLACSDVCWPCGLSLVCPGVIDIPLRGGAPQDTGTCLATVASRLERPIAPSELRDAAASALIDRDGGPEPRFGNADSRRLAALIAQMGAKGYSVQGDVHRLDIEFPDAGQASGSGKLVITPATLEGPCYRRLGGCALGYRGKLTARVAEVVADLIRRNALLDESLPVAAAESSRLPFPREETCFITIGSGCHGRCTYCSLKLARGEARSVDPNDIVDEAKAGMEKGRFRLALISDDAGCWGCDLGLDLPDLLGRLREACPSARFAILDFNPVNLPRIFERVSPFLASIDYLSLPLQAGSDRILGLMERGYLSTEVLGLIAVIRKQYPELHLETDIIVGFPTETREEFLESLRAARAFRRAVFMPFVPEPGTAAAKMAGRIQPAEMRLRMNFVRRLSPRFGFEAVDPDFHGRLPPSSTGTRRAPNP